MKDEFIAILSHELRTPLNSILGWSRMIKSRNLNPQKMEYAIDTIERNAATQAKLIEDILDVSQIVRGTLQLHCQPLNLASVVQTALETVRPTAEAKAIALTLHVQDDSRIQVMADSLRLQQVIWNLLTNAVKFTPEQGQVDIYLAVADELPAAQLPPDRLAASEYALVQITDTGLGIGPDFLPHIFDRFRQADSSTTRSQGGLGLGLAIVRYLVEQHHGVVWAESPGLNQGTTVIVALPLLQSSGATPSPVVLEEPSPLHGTLALAGMPILLVDDDADTRDFLAYLLESQGAVVTALASAKDALQRLDSMHPAILLCDISMPEMDGYALIETIRSQLPEPQAQIPAIALTAHARLCDRALALASGFQGHLPKPIEPAALIRTILQLTVH